MSIDVAKRIVASTPLLSAVDRVEHIPKGFSADDKYALWERGAPKYLLRISDIKLRRRREWEFNVLTHHHSQGIPCSEPYAFAVEEDAAVCYSILGYILGECAEDVLPALTEKQQFEIGIAAGRHLRKLHQLPCPDTDFDWPAHRKAKYLRHVDEAGRIGLAFHRQDEVESYVKANLNFMCDRPVRFQHDDFHPGNLIVRDGGLAGIIDFNRCDWGDPFEDFYKVPMFGASLSVPFARGQILGYFSGHVPREFWKGYNLYVAMSPHPALLWAHFSDLSSLEWWQERIKWIIDTHDFKNSGPPDWFPESP